MTRFLVLPCLLAIALLQGCSSGGKDDSPQIGKVYTDIINYHPSFYEKWPGHPETRISYSFLIRVSDLDGIDNLKTIYVYDTQNDLYYYILGGPDDIPQSENYSVYYDLFEQIFYYPLSLDRVNLSGWQVVAEDLSGKVSRRNFEFVLPNNAPPGNEEYVYSPAYSSPDLNGVPALEAMTIADNALSFERDIGNQFFTIELQTEDARATHYSVRFYDGTSNSNYVGWVRSDSPSIVSSPIVFGQKTVLTLPWSEISLARGVSADQIQGAHIVLYNDPVDVIYSDDYQWFSYLGYSEFLTLPPEID